jgi:hypothetical protein
MRRRRKGFSLAHEALTRVALSIFGRKKPISRFTSQPLSGSSIIFELGWKEIGSWLGKYNYPMPPVHASSSDFCNWAAAGRWC